MHFGGLPDGASCVSSGAYLDSIEQLGLVLPEPVALILHTSIAAYLLPLTYMPNVNDLFGQIDSIILATAQTFVGVGVTASSILGTYPAYIPPTVSTGNLAKLDKENFYWGVSMSSYQNEGHSVDNNWDRFVATGSTTEGQVLEPYENSADFWTNYKSDIALAAGMGLNIMVTRWLIFAKKVVDVMEHANLATPIWYLTFNEAVFYAVVEQKLNDITPNDVVPMLDRIVSCHIQLYAYIHSKRSDAMVSSNLAFIPLGAQEASDALFFDQDPYSCVYALTPTPWLALLEPEGLYYALQFYAEKYPTIPLYVTENGMSTENLEPRADGYLRENLIQDSVYWLQRAVADGMNVLGFNVWTLTDNYEWSTYTPRLGLYSVNITADPALTRIPTAGVATYKGITGRGGVPTGYTPSRGPDDCSLVNPPWSCSNPVKADK
ncbi:hypothetical protein RQP46_010829 [Phenoliferia psychrophenolica]